MRGFLGAVVLVGGLAALAFAAIAIVALAVVLADALLPL